MKPDTLESGKYAQARPVSVGLLFLSWLVPGLGFMAVGRGRRGLTQLVLVVLTFAIGIMLHGGVTWPSWSMRSPEFNLINNITFIIQLGAGLPALVSLVSDLANFPALGGVPVHPNYELGVYYMVVAGAVNYFAVCNLYDRMSGRVSRFRRQETTTTSLPPAPERVNR